MPVQSCTSSSGSRLLNSYNHRKLYAQSYGGCVQWTYYTSHNCIPKTEGYPTKLPPGPGGYVANDQWCDPDICGWDYSKGFNAIKQRRRNHPAKSCDKMIPGRGEQPQVFRNCAGAASPRMRTELPVFLSCHACFVFNRILLCLMIPRSVVNENSPQPASMCVVSTTAG